MAEGSTHNNIVSGNATAINAESIGNVNVNVHLAASPSETEPVTRDRWVREAVGSGVWRHVPAGRDTAHHREQVAAITTSLARMRDELERRLEQDPWCDAPIASTFLGNVDWLLGEPPQQQARAQSHGLDLYPAEAALLVLFPFLHRVHSLRRTARLMEVRPWSLRPEPNAGPLRRAYELFAEENNVLVQRALRDPEAEPLVGWWICHRWLSQHEEFADATSVPDLLRELGRGAEELDRVLAADRLAALLHGLRRGPDVCHPEFLNLLPPDERVRCGPGHQQIRFQRAALLLALGYSMSAEMTTLPDIVAEHLAIPHPVDLDELRRTLTAADWGGSRDLPVLRAECHHEAVVEGLREYTGRADTLLHAVRRTVRERVNQPMPDLPTRLSADGVVPRDGAFDGYARFRSDGRRVLDLAMGIELYKDRDLAVRELYQNALDACRYRRARQEYLDRTTGSHGTPYPGSISFVQGVDDDGRAYLDCVDDGIGMGEAELRGVFSHAGARFAEQLEFKLERARWESLDPPVKLYPNSRFGIGVLSYFMLADEIRVTTCRMDTDGLPGPVLDVAICGPGHLFRIVQTAARGRQPGTRVRLYLRSDIDTASWSAVDVLERVLALAEFPVSAQHGGRTSTWTVGQLKERDARGRTENFGLNAHGRQAYWPRDSTDPQVIWCEHGGALLVDGLLVEPTARGGVLSPNDSGLVGAVVNLRGESSPARLSVDRRNVVDDVAWPVRELLSAATDVLTEGDDRWADFVWLCNVAKGSAVLGDIVASRFSSAAPDMTYRGLAFGDGQAGFFPADVSLVPGDRYTDGGVYAQPDWAFVNGEAPDHIYLWRVLARRPRAALRTLAEVCPEIESAGPVLTPRFSDQWLLQSHISGQGWSNAKGLVAIAEAAARLHLTGREVAGRLAVLGFDDNSPRHWSDNAELTMGNSRTFENAHGRSLTRRNAVSSGALMHAALRSGTGVTSTAAFLRSFGFHITDVVVALSEAAEKDDLLRVDPADRAAGCLDPDVVVPLGHIAQASIRLGLPVSEVCSRLAAHGFRANADRLPAHPSEEDLLLLSAGADGEYPWLDDMPTPAGHVLEVAEKLKLEPSEVLTRLASLGLTPPAPFPPDACGDDIWMLWDETFHECFTPQLPLRYSSVFSQVEDLNDLRHKIDRMRRFGFDLPLKIPSRPTWLDRELLQENSAIDWWYMEVGQVVPFSHVLLAAREVGASPTAVAKRLQACNIPTSHDRLPKGLAFSEALRLLRVDDLPDGEVPEVRHFPLEYLHKTALRKRTGIPEIVSLIRQLGVPLPDPAETIRAALARVPRPQLP
ncbi:ATP-binding protein [Streptomyces sp. GbtcB6]|uniref:wHTH domain-containing protein n=1 Tax=Streptomyces sp. GbtcB6 TaxID=2824751 RepID=UPI0020C7352D|nr:ATP-binding protein [Streptomyces sp. GbtcB6]